MNSTRIVILLIILLPISLFGQIKKLKGEWKVNLVTQNKDTLYYKDSLLFTAKFYNQTMKNEQNTESDFSYIKRCSKTTYNTFKNITLIINKKSLSMSPIKPCLDFIEIEKIQNEKYHYVDNKSLIESNSIKLQHLQSKKQLVYSDKEQFFKMYFYQSK